MYVKKNLMLWAAVFVLAMPLMFTGIAGATTAGPSTFTPDGAVHDAATGQWIVPNNFYCIAAPASFTSPTSGAFVPPAELRSDLTSACSATNPVCAACTIASTAVKNAVKYSNYPTNTVKRTVDECVALGYAWSGYSGACNASAWTTDDPDNSPLPYYTDHKGCVRCHNTAYMIGPDPAHPLHDAWADKQSYVNGGHKNMSRPADGKKWNMPGVTDSSLANPELAGADLNADGSFSDLWIQEDYPRQPINWSNGQANLAYCAKDATGAVGVTDLPDLTACPDCESPIFGNGKAGYPLGYSSAMTCTTAAANQGKTYTWTTNSTFQVYWVYGGAGLEGGPPMMEPGTQYYWCGRCHTTGWTANNSGDAAITGKTKLPFSNTVTGGIWEGVDFTTKTAIGSSKLLLNPASAGYTLSSWDQFGIMCSRCHVATNGEPSKGNPGPNSSGHASWPVSAPSVTTPGGDVVAMCMTCHRNDSGDGSAEPRPVANQNGYTASLGGATTDTSNNAATPFTNRAGQPDGFAHHPDGPEFLNSPHAKFSGSWQQIGCPPMAMSGYGDTSTRIGNPLGTPLTALAVGITPTAAGQCQTGTMNMNGSTASLYASKFAQAAKVDLGVSDTAAGSCVTCHDVHKPHNENVEGMGGDSALEHTCQECHQRTGGSTITPQITVINHPSGTGTPLADSNPCEVCHQPAGIKHIWRINVDPNYSTYGNYTGYVDNSGTAQAGGGSVNLSNRAADGAYTNAVWIDIDNACGQCHGGGVSNTNLSTTTTATIALNTAVSSITVADTRGFAAGKEVAIAGAGVNGAAFNTIIASVNTVTKTVNLTYATAAIHPVVAPGAVVTVAGNPTANGAPYATKADLAKAASIMHTVGGVYTPVSSATPSASNTGLTQTGYTVSFTDNSSDADDTKNLDVVTVSWGDGAISTGVRSGVFTHPYAGTRVRSYAIVHTVRDSVDPKLVSKESIKVTVPMRYSVSGTVATNAYVYLKQNNHTRKIMKATGGTYSFTNVLPGVYTLHTYLAGSLFTDITTTVSNGNVTQNIP